MRKAILPLLAAIAALFAVVVVAPVDATGTGPNCSAAGTNGTINIVGLTSNAKLVCFRETAPGSASVIGTISGLAMDTRIVGIDRRPATGALYGLGDMGGVYTLSTASGAATFVSRLDMPLSGVAFGVDFNPTVDRLRVVSDTGKNIRVNVDTGMVTPDTDLNTGTPPVTSLGIAGVAYTNNDADPNTATTLFDLDTVNDQVSIQSPPNNGSLAPTGKLGVDTSSAAGFDIYSDLNSAGSTWRVRGYASLSVGTKTSLYTIGLYTGKAGLRGAFPAANPVVDIAVPIG